jgi:hypothetical protein
MSRPRKNILLYCNNDIRLSCLRFVISNVGAKYPFPGYTVHGAKSNRESIELANQHPTDFYHAAVVVYTHKDDSSLVLSRYLSAVRVIPTIFLNEGLDKFVWMKAHATVSLPHMTPVAEWMERLRILCARRRGPKPGPKSCNQIEPLLAKTDEVIAKESVA